MCTVRVRWRLTVFLLGAVLIPSSINAFVLSGFSWSNAQTIFLTSPHSTSGSGLSSTQLTSAFTEALDLWSSQTAFNFQATSGSADPCNTTMNSYTFASTNCGGVFSSTTLAVATTFFTFNNTATNATATRTHIVFNSNQSWNITGVTTGLGSDFRRVAVHELGHSLGLEHTDVSPAIMLPSVSSTQVPQSNDLNGVEAIYGPFNPTALSTFFPAVYQLLLFDD